MTAVTAFATRDILGVPVAAATMTEVVDHVHGAIMARAPLQIGVVNAAKLVNMQRDSQLARDVLACDVVLADGMAVVWASRLLNRPVPERVAGIDLMHAMFERGTRHGYRVYCLGATQEVLDQALAVLGRDYPGIIFAGSHHGYFSAADDAAVDYYIQLDLTYLLMLGIILSF
jgi:N-acetylglucosaminyldiphosphoundecaprenol N-acetyl-beta-D-mannosaminyltransferase